MRGWHRLGDSVQAEFDPDEARVIDELAQEVVGVIVETRRGGTDPDDPIVARLFPSAYADDGDEAEFRRLAREDLATEKIRSMHALMDGFNEARIRSDDDDEDDEAGRLLGPDGRVVWLVILGQAERELWLRGLTDLRLVLHERTRDGVADMRPTLDDDEVEQLRLLADWLGAIQGSLLEA